MRPTSLLWLAIVSAATIAMTIPAASATRPHYGGSLRIALTTSLSSLDPADPSNASATGIRNVAPLIFDTLTVLDSHGDVLPSLAVAWKSDFNAQRWELQLRSGVSFSDGTPVTVTEVASSLRYANPQWKVSSAGQSLVIETDLANMEIPAELALPRNSIVARSGSKLVGTGPFTITQWNTGKNLVLAAREDYWNGRPFLDSVEVAMGRSPRDQSLAFDLGRIDVVELPPGQPKRAPSVQDSAPNELLAIVFNHDAQSPEEGRLRQTLSSVIDRVVLSNVATRGAGEPANGLLPNWMTGYEFIFSAPGDIDSSHPEPTGKTPPPVWKLESDQNDAMLRLIAERVALNAQDAGIHVQLVSSGPSDMRLTAIPLASRNPQVALSQLALALHLSPPAFHGASVEGLYLAEDAIRLSQRIIPLLHLRSSVGLARSVRGWSEGQDGSWNLADVWLNAEKP